VRVDANEITDRHACMVAAAGDTPKSTFVGDFWYLGERLGG
jgi:hypothetical protein